MKTLIAALLAVLGLLFVDLAGAQTPMTRQTPVRPTVTQGSAGRPAAMRGAMAAHFPVGHRPPSFVRPPFFRHHHPFFFGGYGSSLSVAGTSAAPSYAYGYEYPGYVQSAAYDQLAQYRQPQYWAYCRNPQGYYPYVSECPAGWLPVTPTSPPPPLVPGQTSLDAGQQPKAPPSDGDSIEEIRARIARSRAD